MRIFGFEISTVAKFNPILLQRSELDVLDRQRTPFELINWCCLNILHNEL